MATWRAAEAGKAALKLSTNLTGMTVAKNPHHVLGLYYSKTLRALAKMPSDYPYRKYTEEVMKKKKKYSSGTRQPILLLLLFQVIQERSAILKSSTDLQELEKKIGCGQIEEIMIQAKNELTLARKTLEWKSWEPLVAEPPSPNQWKWPL